jgi:type VI secretion system protein ImpJ
MKPRPKVSWAEGLLMMPQHLQQLDSYHESLIATRLAALDPLSWGVVQMQLDDHALDQRSAGLAYFEGILPDGMPLWLGAGYPLPIPRVIEGHFPPSQAALEVFVGVPKERSGANNFGSDGEPLRYNVQTRKVFDLGADDQSADVGFATPNAVLLFGDESRDAYVTMKVAEIVRDSKGALTASDTYMPPCLRVAAAPVFALSLQRLLAKMVSRHRALTESRRHAGEGRLEFTAADVTRYLQLHALNGALPALHYLLEVGDISPRNAFLMLSQLAGQLATFSTQADMTQPLPFDYGDLRGTFKPLFALLDMLVSVTDTEQYVACTLKPHGNTYVGDLGDERLPRCQRYLFAVESALPRAHVIDEFIGKAKIASHADIDIVTAQAIRGVPVEANKQLPPQIPPRPGVVYFDVSVDKDFVYWKHVWQDRNVEVRMPPSFERDKTKIQLLGVLEAQRG